VDEEYDGVNFVFEIRGSDLATDRVTMASAHYDTVTTSPGWFALYLYLYYDA
jgi:hypothetical protein